MTILSRNQVIEQALGRIGAFTVNMMAPRDGEIERAAVWLDMVVAHETARSRKWWLVDETQTFDVVASQSRYDLNQAIGLTNAPRGIQFFIGAYLYDVAAGRDVCDLAAWKREEYEARPDKAALGTPSAIYVDRGDKPLGFLYPTPSDARAWKVRLLFQSYSTDFVNAQPTSKAYKMRHSWQLWMVEELAASIGAGPIRRLPGDEVKEMRARAIQLRNDLEGEDDQQHAAEPRHVEYFNGI